MDMETTTDDHGFPSCVCTKAHLHMHPSCLLEYYRKTRDERCCFCRRWYTFPSTMLESRHQELQTLFLCHAFAHQHISVCEWYRTISTLGRVSTRQKVEFLVKVVGWQTLEASTRLWKGFRAISSVVFSCIFFNYFLLHFLLLFRCIFSSYPHHFWWLLVLEFWLICFVSGHLLRNVSRIWELYLPDWVEWIVLLHIVTESLVLLQAQQCQWFSWRPFDLIDPGDNHR